MTTALDELNQQWQRRGLPTVGVGIGINTGVVVAGNMGSEKRLNYTVIGDGVNLAYRLEELTKTPEYDARVIVSGATLAKAKDRAASTTKFSPWKRRCAAWPDRVEFPECIIEQPSAAKIISAASLALDWEVGAREGRGDCHGFCGEQPK